MSIELNQNKPIEDIKKPIKTIFQAPNLSLKKPSTGPNNAPPNLPNEETPETIALDHPNSSSTALKITLPALKVGILEKKALTPPARLTHQP